MGTSSSTSIPIPSTPIDVLGSESSMSPVTPTTTVSLEQIWEQPLDDIKAMLLTSGITPSPDNNRSILASLYYKSGQLREDERALVIDPNFVRIMRDKISFNTRMARLKKHLVPIKISLDNSTVYLNQAPIRELIELAIYFHIPRYVDAVMYASRASGSHVGQKLFTNMIGYFPNDLSLLDLEIQIVPSITQAIKSNVFSSGEEKAAAIWKLLLQDPRMRSIAINLPVKAIIDKDLYKIIDNLLNEDLTGVVPIARCFYLYRISRILNSFPQHLAYHHKWSDLVNTVGCAEVFAPVPEPPKGLSPSVETMKDIFHEGALGEIIGTYVGRPPTYQEIEERLFALT